MLAVSRQGWGYCRHRCIGKSVAREPVFEFGGISWAQYCA